MKINTFFPILIVSICALFFTGTIHTELVKNDRPLAFVKRFKPNVDVQNSTEDRSKRLDLDEDKAEQLFDGDTLRTDNDGYALVVFMDQSIAKVKPRSLLIVKGESELTSKRFGAIAFVTLHYNESVFYALLTFPAKLWIRIRYFNAGIDHISRCS